MRAYWLGLLYALLSASVSYITANGLGPSTKIEVPPKSEQEYRDWYNRDRKSGSLTLNRTAGNHVLERYGVQTARPVNISGSDDSLVATVTT